MDNGVCCMRQGCCKVRVPTPGQAQDLPLLYTNDGHEALFSTKKEPQNKQSYYNTVLFCYFLSSLHAHGGRGCGNIATILYIKKCHEILRCFNVPARKDLGYLCESSHGVRIAIGLHNREPFHSNLPKSLTPIAIGLHNREPFHSNLPKLKKSPAPIAIGLHDGETSHPSHVLVSWCQLCLFCSSTQKHGILLLGLLLNGMLLKCLLPQS